MIDQLPDTFLLDPVGRFAPISNYPNLSLPAGYGLPAGIMGTTGQMVLDVFQQYANQSVNYKLENTIID